MQKSSWWLPAVLGISLGISQCAGAAVVTVPGNQRRVAVFRRSNTLDPAELTPGDAVVFWSATRPEVPLLARIGNAQTALPPGHTWLEDAVSASEDSRAWGPLPLALVAGRVLWTFPWFGK